MPPTRCSCLRTNPVAARYATLIAGAAEVAEALRAEGVKIGTTTGYTHEIMAKITPVAARQGFVPDSLVCTGDTPEGRPTPLMSYKTLLNLGVWPAWSAAKIDDTEVGIAEGLNGWAWTVGVAASGNVFGLSLEDMLSLSPEEFDMKRSKAEQRLMAAGAHYVIDPVADLMSVLTVIEGRLARGERP
jgi:phosphonoacetaldehyde hydrolase